MVNSYIKSTLQLRDFQLQAIDFAYKRKKSVIALPTGTGKTITSLAWFAKIKQDHPNAKLLYVTEKSLVLQAVEQDLPTYFNFTFDYVYNNTKAQRLKIYDRFINSLDILVINYHSLRNDFDDIGLVFAKLNSQVAVVFDEATAFKHANSKISKCVTLLTKATPACIALTATPCMSGLYDLFNILRGLNASPYKSVSEFESLHCEFTYTKLASFSFMNARRVAIAHIDKKNEELKAQGRMYNVTFYFSLTNAFKIEKGINFIHKPSQGIFSVLNAQNGSFSWSLPCNAFLQTSLTALTPKRKLFINIKVFDQPKHKCYKNLSLFKDTTSNLMFVRAKDEIARELPPVTIQYRYVDYDADTKKAIANLYENGKTSASQIEIALNTPQVYLKSLRDDYINPKLEDLIDFLSNDIPEDKCIVYFPYTQTTQILKQILSDKLNTDVAYVTGESETDNNAEVKRFLADSNTRILVGTSSVLKGLNLQSVNYIAILQKPYTFGNYQQLIGRINRIGGDYTPKTIVNFITKDSRDEDIKTAVLEQALLTYKLNPKLVENGLIPASLLNSNKKGMTEQEAKSYLDEQFLARRVQFIKK